MSESSSGIAARTEPSVRPGTREDTDRILDLVTLSLGEGKIPRNRSYWEWKHELNPFGSSPVLLSEANGELVGLRVFMRWSWMSADRLIPAVRAVDTATHPQWRGRGIFSKLTLALVDRVREEGAGFVFNTPNEQSRPGYLKMGWKALGRLTPWVRLARPSRLVRGWRSGRASDEDSPGVTSSANRVGLAELLQHANLDSFLAGSRAAESRLHTPLTGDYLRWRYLDIPGFGYDAASDFDGDRGAAIVYRIKSHPGFTELRICETIVGTGGGSRRIARSLLRDVVSSSGCDYATALSAAGTAEQTALLTAGFLPAVRRGPLMTIRPLNPVAGVDPLDRAVWRVAAGDLELF
jgi:GNAT superfamily N-acetyltransferase